MSAIRVHTKILPYNRDEYNVSNEMYRQNMPASTRTKNIWNRGQLIKIINIIYIIININIIKKIHQDMEEVLISPRFQYFVN